MAKAAAKNKKAGNKRTTPPPAAGPAQAQGNETLTVIFNQRTIEQFGKTRKIISPWTIASTLRGGVGTRVLVPGTNEISKREWEGYDGHEANPKDPSDIKVVKVPGLKDVPDVQKALANGDLELLTPLAGKKTKAVATGKSGQRLAQDLGAYDEEAAIKYVKGTVNMTALKRWQAVEGRDDVAKAITQQMEEVEKLEADQKDKP